MEEYVKDILSRDVKILNDINQVVKKSFLRYFVVRTGVIFTDDTGTVMESGTHFSHVEKIDKLMELIDIPEGYAILFDSAAVYTHIRDNKKHIKYIKSSVEGIYLSGEENDHKIGEYVKFDESFLKTYEGLVDRIVNKGDNMLSDETIQALLRNEIITEGHGDKKVRLTKTLFPHIKEGVPIGLSFNEHEDPALFEVTIHVYKDKEKVTNYHVYTCIKY